LASLDKAADGAIGWVADDVNAKTFVDTLKCTLAVPCIGAVHENGLDGWVLAEPFRDEAVGTVPVLHASAGDQHREE
jgi:hypothetical protein